LTVITLTKDEIISKITALIHFSIRSGSALIGQNRLETVPENAIDLVMISEGTSGNTERNLSVKFGEGKVMKLNCEVELGKLIGKEGVKVIGFKKSGLSKEIIKLIKSCGEI
jgi:hypothetical protein